MQGFMAWFLGVWGTSLHAAYFFLVSKCLLLVLMNLYDILHPHHVLEIPLQLQQSRLWSHKITYRAGSRLEWPTKEPPVLVSRGRDIQQHQRRTCPLALRQGVGKWIALGNILNYLGYVWPSLIPADPTISSWNWGIQSPSPWPASLALQSPCWCGGPPPSALAFWYHDALLKRQLYPA